jgi:hypothetical protein
MAECFAGGNRDRSRQGFHRKSWWRRSKSLLQQIGYPGSAVARVVCEEGQSSAPCSEFHTPKEKMAL